MGTPLRTGKMAQLSSRIRRLYTGVTLRIPQGAPFPWIHNAFLTVRRYLNDGEEGNG
jgi:hypothetical protein